MGFIVGVAKENSEKSAKETISWMKDTKKRIQTLRKIVSKEDKVEHLSDPLKFTPNRSKAQYQRDIARSHKDIKNGESYELCVTNHLEAEFDLPNQPTRASYESPFELYKLLRRRNPAPFSAFMNFFDNESAGSGNVSICCSSPERFLSVKMSTSHQQKHRKFVVESKPIKGTAARYIGSETDAREIDSKIAKTLEKSVKNRAENLMIVDLVRNDLGRVCEVGSVHVLKLMHIESYATVHQMVSTVRGTLDGERTNVIDAITACFPGGSMTGAPKQRTMEILDEIEQGVSRGPYSGCLGYISLNGCMDMNIVIRSAILTPVKTQDSTSESWKASIGCGGAVTHLSDPDDEYEEMILKSQIVQNAITEWRNKRMSQAPT